MTLDDLKHSKLAALVKFGTPALRAEVQATQLLNELLLRKERETTSKD